MIVTLASVKMLNKYDYFVATAPTVAEKEPTYVNGQTWLNTTTGYSYALVDQTSGTWERIEQDKDYIIEQTADDTLIVVSRYINNPFVITRNIPYDDLGLDSYRPSLSNWNNRDQFELQEKESVFSKWVFNSSAKTITVVTDENIYGSLNSFVAGDYILVSGCLRNNGYFTIASVVGNTITVNENLYDGTEYAKIFLSIIPQGFKNIVSRIINYDVYERNETGKGMESERWGTYSYTRMPMSNNLKYPDQILSGLDTYELMATGGLNVFID